MEQEIYKPTGDPEELATRGDLKGRTLHSVGIYPGEEEETTRYLFCVCEASVCASITVYTSPANFKVQKSLYDQIFTSVVFKSTD